MSYTRLSGPIAIRGLELKNRMIIPAIHLASTDNGACTNMFLHFYRRRALGGAGLIITGSCRFDEYGSDRLSMSLASDEMIPVWKNFTDEIHKCGCPVAVQLFHAGRYVRQKDVICGRPALSPSEGFCNFTRETTPGMTAEQIEELKEAYYLGARRAVLAGFDAVEISGSSGYLLCQFLSPLVNKRTDRYGGSFENRCRLPLEVIQTVRKAVGEDYPVFYRLGADDLVEGSNTLEDILPFAALAEKAGVDCFNVTGGWHESKIPQLTGEVPRGGLRFLAAAVKNTVSVPVIANNRINDPKTAEMILALGEADMTGVGRACIADPDFPKKVLEDRADEIRPCIACNQGCLGNVFFGKPLTCHVNSEAGHEFEREAASKVKNEGSCGAYKKEKSVLIVGGGPAGCEAALKAARKGSKVTIWEKSGSLGGQLKLAAKAPGKQEFETLIEFYHKNLAKAGVQVVFHKECDLDPIKNYINSDTSSAVHTVPEVFHELSSYDEVIFACGGRPKETALNRTEDSIPVFTDEEILSGKAVAGKKVVVIGGSFIGCETARYLAAEGSAGAEDVYYLSKYNVCKPDRIHEMADSSRREITIVEKKKKIGYGYEPGTAWPVLADLERYGVKKLKNTEALRVTSQGVIIREDQGEEHLLECDTVVTTFGVEPDAELKRICGVLETKAVVLGNARKTGKSIDAIAEGQLYE